MRNMIWLHNSEPEVDDDTCNAKCLSVRTYANTVLLSVYRVGRYCMTSQSMSDTVFEVKWLGPSPCDSWPGRWSIMEMRLKTGRDKNGA